MRVKEVVLHWIEFWDRSCIEYYNSERQERRGKGLLVDIYFMFGLSGRCGGAGMYGRRSGKGSGDSWLQ